LVGKEIIMQERERILKLLEEGKINADEAARLLEALGERSPQWHGPRGDFGERIARKVELKLKDLPDIIEKSVSVAGMGFVTGSGEERELQFDPKPNLEIKAVSGDVNITGDDESNIRIKLVNGHKINNKAEDTLIVKTMSGDLDVNVPRRQKVILKAASGDVQVADLAEISVKCGSGDMKVSNVTEIASISLGSGDLDMEKITGVAAVSLGSGDLEGVEISAELSVSTGSGDVDLDIIECKGGKIEAGSGDVDLFIPEKSDVEITVHIPQKRELETDFEAKKSKESPSERLDEYKIVIGKPKTKLFVRAKYGDVSIHKRSKK